MNIYSIADLLTGLVEAVMMIMLCDTFTKKRCCICGYFQI